MQIFGRLFRIFGGGMNKVSFIASHVRYKEVLDLGALGHGLHAVSRPNWVHRHLCLHARECVGLDFIEDDVIELRQDGYDIRVGDAQSFDLGRKFDVIVAGDIVEHLHDPQGFFTCCRTHLRPEGQLILTTANPWFFVRIAQAILRGHVYENPEHVMWYSIRTLSEMLRRHGFVATSVEYGSSEDFLYRLFFLPKVIRHTSIWLVAVPD